jgi:hypothetical protein
MPFTAVWVWRAILLRRSVLSQLRTSTPDLSWASWDGARGLSPIVGSQSAGADGRHLESYAIWTSEHYDHGAASAKKSQTSHLSELWAPNRRMLTHGSGDYAQSVRINSIYGLSSLDRSWSILLRSSVPSRAGSVESMKSTSASTNCSGTSIWGK